MFNVISCLTTEHDFRLVLTAAVICLLGTVTSFLLLERSKHRPGAPSGWTLAAGAATGVTIWATHFIAMLAYDGGVPIGFGLGVTALSAAAGVVIATAGYVIAAPGGSTRVAFGGAVIGIGIGAMHFIGMAAMEAPARLTYRPIEVAVAVIGGATLAGAALILFHAMRPRHRILAAALTLTLSICTLHFVSMSAMTLLPDPTVRFDPLSVDRSWLAYAIASVDVFLLLLAIGAVIANRRLEVQFAESRRFRSLADASAEGIIIARGQHILEMNEQMQAFLREERDPAEVSTVADLLPGLDFVHRAEDRRAREGRLVLGPTKAIPVEVLHRTIQHHGAAAEVIVLRDLRERQEASARIEYLALHDPLTGLPNRAMLNDRLAQALEQAEADDEKLAVLCLDLDRFKAVNDVYGHGVGDAVLRKVAATLDGLTRDDDTVARLGGDEFVILQRGADQPEGAQALAKRLVQAFEDQFGSDVPSIGVSIGIAMYPDDGTTAEALLCNGDTALYRAKNEGRGTWRFFEAAMDEALRERRMLEQQLRLAHSQKQLYLAYQPQADAHSGEVIGFEALVRWQHPIRGLVPPGVFIPLAEESGYITQLGLWILREAAREAAGWDKPLNIAVNLSPVQFYQSDLAEKIEAILVEVGLDPRRLELEITEGTLLHDRDAVLKILHKLKAMGVRIAMDDFGTGYSSLSNLQCFPFDKIKIDRSFVSTLETDPASVAIIRAIVGLGKGFRMPVVAEGVETEEQHEILRAENCAEVQGYLFGAPQPISHFDELTRAPMLAAA